MKNYQEIRHQLVLQLKELQVRLNAISDDVKHINQPLEQDFSEQASANENNEVLDALGNSALRESEAIKQAIAKIDAVTYGICAYCGETIQEQRLQALPYISLCLDCAQHQHENR